MRNRDEIPLDSRDYAGCESEAYLSLLGSRSHLFAIRASEWALANGSPEPGYGWEKAHTPLPRGLGDEWVWLPYDLHQIHGLLQSIDIGRPCYYPGLVKKFFHYGFFCDGWFDLWDIWEDLMREKGREFGRIGGKKSRPSHEDAVKAGRTGKTWELTSPKGEVFITDRLNDFCDSQRLNSSNIRQVAYGNRKTHKGWTACIINHTFK